MSPPKLLFMAIANLFSSRSQKSTQVFADVHTRETEWSKGKCKNPAGTRQETQQCVTAKPRTPEADSVLTEEMHAATSAERAQLRIKA